MPARRIVFDIHARAATGAPHLFHPGRKCLDFIRLQTADEILLAQKLCERDQAPMSAGTTVIVEAPTASEIIGTGKASRANRAGRLSTDKIPHRIARRVDALEHFYDRAGREGNAFLLILSF